MKKIAAALLVALALAAPACSKKKATGAQSQTSQYCTLAQQLEDSSRALDQITAPTAGAVRNAFAAMKAKVDEVDPHVPADLRADFNIVRDAFRKAYDELVKIDFDFSKAGPELQALFADQSIDQASERLDTANKQKCPGIVLSNETPSPSGSSSVPLTSSS